MSSDGADAGLYNKATGINELMRVYIHRYFVTHLNIDDESAEKLHKTYYKEYGLAIEGLVRYNGVDALEYNREVDDALPLDTILKPDPELRKMLLSIDRSKVKKLWLFTNAYKTHGHRVVKLLGIDDLFDGMTFCDYSQYPLVCKPKEEMFAKALKEAGVTDVRNCIYVDDSALNIRAATELGWGETILFAEEDSDVPEKPPGKHVVRSLMEIPQLLPDIFVQSMNTLEAPAR